MSRSTWLYGLALLLLAPGAGAQSIPLSPCRVAGIDAEVRCGVYSVRENRGDPGSRLIPLKIIVLPARTPRPASDPVWLVSPGGPGTTNSEFLPARMWPSWLRDDRDLVIVDLRGTSGPTRMDCDLSDPAAPDAQYLGTLFPRDRIARCRDALAKALDLHHYTTPIIVGDLDEVRRALGYGKVNLWADSWGTRVVFLWLRTHPETVRSAILEGSAPVSLLNPLPHARTAQDAIDTLFAECQRQPRCHASFPDVRAELDSVVARLRRRPATVRVAGTGPGDSAAVPFTWPAFGEALRVLMYYPPASQRVPLLVHRAFQGDYRDFAAAAIASNKSLRQALRFGFLLTITCTEDVPRIDPATIERETAHTFLGDTRVREQIAACAGWPRGDLSAHYGDPVRSSVPVFLLSGNADPVAAPALSADAAKYLPNAIHVVAPGGHAPTGPCIDRMERAFLEAASPRAVDTSCVAGMRLPEFQTSEAAGRASRVPFLGD